MRNLAYSGMNGDDPRMDPQAIRILVASTLGKIVEPRLGEAFEPRGVTIAVDAAQVRAAVDQNLRFDVVLADLTWNDVGLEYRFDGLDVLDLVHRLQRPAPVIFAVQGHGIERDHLDEAAERAGVAGVIKKSAGIEALVPVLRRVAAGHPADQPPASPGPTLYTYFSRNGSKGVTAARMAGAIAARRASDYDSLATAAKISKNTATKIKNYLGPLIADRKDHPVEIPMTVESIYRWCGEHSRYLVSWCRRHGHEDIIMNDATYR